MPDIPGSNGLTGEIDTKRLALFLRYHAVHERSYYRALREFQNLRRQQQKEQVGFESQNRKALLEQLAEQRKQELHESRICVNNARATNARSDAAEFNTAVRKTFEATEFNRTPGQPLVQHTANPITPNPPSPGIRMSSRGSKSPIYPL